VSDAEKLARVREALDEVAEVGRTSDLNLCPWCPVKLCQSPDEQGETDCLWLKLLVYVDLWRRSLPRPGGAPLDRWVRKEGGA